MSDRPKNIIIVSIDDLRFDCISYAEEKRYLEKLGVNIPETPNIDWFAENGVFFAQAITTATYTTTSHASLFTGLYPPSHGVRSFLKYKLSPHIPTLNSILKAEGYTTFFFNDTKACFEFTGLTRDTDIYVQHDLNRLFYFLEKYKNKPIYLFLHFFDVHEPYGYSEFEPYPGYNSDFFEKLKSYKYLRKYFENKPWEKVRWEFPEIMRELYRKGYKREIVQLYVEGVEKFDKGKFSFVMENLKRLNLLDGALLIILSDHGEAPYPKYFGHGGVLTEEAIRIPMIFYFPGYLPKGKIINSETSLIDIVPTIIDMVFPGRKEFCFDGKSLLTLINNGEKDKTRPLYSEVWRFRREEMEKCIVKAKGDPRKFRPDFDTFLEERCIRTRKFKLRVKGEEVFEGIIEKDGVFSWIYHNILHTFVKKRAYRVIVKKAFEKIEAKKYYFYDISKDIWEKNNLLDGKLNAEMLSIVENFQDIMEEISQKWQITKKMDVDFYSSEEVAEVEKQLKNLGYI